MVRLLLVSGILALCAAPQHVFAQDEQDTAVARTFFYEGIACADAGDHACAADRFARSNELRPSPVVVFNQAQAEAELGHLVVASELYRTVSRTAEGELAQAAQSSLDAILPRLAQVTLVVDTSARVMLGDFEMQEAVRGVAVPLDPGEHHLRAFYGDQVAAEDTFFVREGESITHTFIVPPPVADLTVQEVPESVESSDALSADHTTRRRALGITFGVIAAVGIAVLVAVLLRPSDPDPTQTDLAPIIFE